jgi:hypothetical protein
MSKVNDLDILRPEPKILKINGKEIDVSFIPCGITFDIDDVIQEMSKINVHKLLKDRKEAKRAFDLGVKLCSIFCSHRYKEMDEQWFRDNATSQQIDAFALEIQSALMKTYEDVNKHSKN